MFHCFFVNNAFFSFDFFTIFLSFLAFFIPFPIRAWVIVESFHVFGKFFVVSHFFQFLNGESLMPVFVVPDFDDSGEAKGRSSGIRIRTDDLGGFDFEDDGLFDWLDPAVGFVLNGVFPWFEIGRVEFVVGEVDVVFEFLPEQGQVLRVVAGADFCERVHNISFIFLIFIDEPKCKSGHLINPVTAFALPVRLVAKIASYDNKIKGVSEAVNIVALEFEPVEPSLFWHIQRLGVFEHDAFFVAADTGTEFLEDVIKFRDDFVLNYLQFAGDCFERIF
jgi:hypothetical protein